MKPTKMECVTCGVPFWITKNYMERRQEDGKYFYCPNGHPIHFLDSAESRIKKLETQLAKKRLDEIVSDVTKSNVQP